MALTTVAVYTICDDLLISIGRKEHSCVLLSNFPPFGVKLQEHFTNWSVRSIKSIRI